MFYVQIQSHSEVKGIRTSIYEKGVCVCVCVCACVCAQSCPTLCDPWTVAHQASLQPRDLPNPGIERNCLLHWQADSPPVVPLRVSKSAHNKFQGI